MEQEKEKKLTWKTNAGCKRWLAIFIVIMIVFGLFGCLFQSDFGKIKIEHIKTDARGAALDGELYYPAGTSSHDSLPAVVVAHGGANTYGTTKNIASELARRGFVVFNFSAYSQGLSEQPYYDDSDQGKNGLNIVKTPAGVYDAVNFVRTLKFVDKTRIGLYGHSMGAYRADFVINEDCGYYTLNDTMINVLANQFGQTFTEQEINENADTLAKERLNKDQFALYSSIRKDKETQSNGAIKSVCIMGIDHCYSNDVHKVKVAGHDVLRSVQTNIGFIDGQFDEFVHGFGSCDFTKAAWYSPKTDLKMGSWYGLNDTNGSSSIIGNMYKSSVRDDSGLASAVSKRMARVFFVTPGDTHPKETISPNIISAVSEFFTQTLSYNRGELTNPNTVPLASGNTIFMFHVICNTLTLLAMVGILIALCGTLLYTESFAPCRIEEDKVVRAHFSGIQYWIYSAVLFLVGFFAIYYANQNALRLGWLCDKPSWPISRPASVTAIFLLIVAIGSVITIAAFALLKRKNKETTGIGALNIGIKFKNILKYLLIGLILLVIAYTANSVLEYFFGQDFRIWQTAFSQMKAENWVLVLKYAVVLLPLYFCISCGINYMVRTDIPEWKDTLITVVMNTLPIWLCCFISYAVAQSTPFTGRFFSDFLSSYSFLGLMPIITYINRRMYKSTKSIWLSAFVSTLLVAWCTVSSLGTGDLYYSQNWLGNLIGF